MQQSFPVKPAEELMDEEFTAKWRDRQALDPLPRRVLGVVLEQFVATGGPLSLDALPPLLPDLSPSDVREAAATLDEKDLIATSEGHIVLAYPFAGAPTAFTVVLPDGRERHAVCAVDALGVPALLRERVQIRSRCHHCQEPLALAVGPDGPVVPSEAFVWVGDRGDLRQKAFSSL